nr:hypothetical protein LVJ77_10140 [Conchiformibius kuhniae]
MAALPARADTYICVIDGKPVFTSVRVQPQCVRSQMDGIAESASAHFAPPPTVSAAVALPNAAASAPAADTGEDDIARIWKRAEYGRFDDTPILPPAPKPPPAATVVPPKKTVAPRPAGIAPPPKPPSRRQILENDIRREQTALTAAQKQLQAARKRGDAAAAQRWEHTVRDREANLRALNEEWRR